MLAAIYRGSRAAAHAFDQALVTDMVLTQPVVYEFGRLRPRTLLIVGERDTTAIGKQCKQHPVFFPSLLGMNSSRGILAALHFWPSGPSVPRTLLLKPLLWENTDPRRW